MCQFTGVPTFKVAGEEPHQADERLFDPQGHGVHTQPVGTAGWIL